MLYVIAMCLSWNYIGIECNLDGNNNDNSNNNNKSRGIIM